MVRRLIDPAVAELITPPDSIREYAQSARHGYMLVFDNVSEIAVWLSDAMCRTATGDAFEKRALYTDEEDIVWRYRRPIVINGIGSIVTRADLLDRSLLVTLDAFAENERRSEELIWEDFEKARPKILGALLDIVAGVLRVLPQTEGPTAYRMADFARIGCAVETVLGWSRGAFSRAMDENASAQVEEAIDASPVALATIALMDAVPEWSGTATTLFKLFKTTWEKDSMGALPKAPNKLSMELKRIAPSLRRIGINIRTARSSDESRTRIIIIEKKAKVSSGPSGSSRSAPPAEPTSESRRPQESVNQEVAEDAKACGPSWTIRTIPDDTSPTILHASSSDRPVTADGALVEGEA